MNVTIPIEIWNACLELANYINYTEEDSYDDYLQENGGGEGHILPHAHLVINHELYAN